MSKLGRRAFLGVGVVLLSLLTGCKKYTVSSDVAFLTGLGEYPKGAQVEVVLEIWATDTDYTFYLNGESVKASFDYQRGYLISFPMPGHDVRVTYDARSSMAWESE